MPVRPRYRHHHQPGRGRPDLGNPQGAPHRWGTRGQLSGDGRILQELDQGPDRLRVGFRPDGRAPMREGTDLFAPDGTPIGRVTSGGFAPTLDAPVAMGYVAVAHAAPGTSIEGEVRGRRVPATVVPLPFRPSTYKR